MSLRVHGGRGAVAGLALGLLPIAGCSWVFVQRPPAGPLPPAPPLACTSQVAAPVADTVGAVLLGVGGGMVAAAGLGMTQECEPWCTGEKAVLVAIGLLELGAATVLAFSAGHGYSATAECRDLKEAQLSCTSGVEASCLGLRERKPR
jgi:hypothetical protein